MAQFESLTHGIHCIDALYIRPRVASIYLLIEGDEAAVVETGTRHSMDNVLATLRALSIERTQVKYVIPTHVHLDHAGGAGEMMRQFEQARLIVHPRGARHMIDPSRLIEGTIGVYGEENFRRLYGSIEPIPETRVSVAEDGARFRLGQRELLFIDTPGHARHHFCIFDAQSGGVFTGDTFGLSYDSMKTLPRGLIPTTPPNQFDPPALRRSIARIMELGPGRLYLTHYGEYLDPAAQLDSFDRWIDDYQRICEAYDTSEPDLEERIERDLLQCVLSGLGGEQESLRRVIGHDIRLNAQGLAHWRRTAARRRDSNG